MDGNRQTSGAIVSTQRGNGGSAISTDVAAANSLLARVEARTVWPRKGQAVFPAGEGLTAPERGDIEGAIVAIDAALEAPIDGRAVRQAFRQLDAVRGRADRNENDIVDAWLIGLKGLKASTFTEAIRRIHAGEAPEVPPRFMPGPELIAALARRIEAEWRLRQERMRRLLALPEEPSKTADAPLTTEQRAEMDATLERIRRAASKGSGFTSTPATRQSGRSAAARVAAEIAGRKAAMYDTGRLRTSEK